MRAKGKKHKPQPKSANTDMVRLGKRMKQLRVKKGYSSFEIFAYDHDLSRVLYGNYEQGKGNITYKNLMKIIRGLGISVEQFFSEGFD